MGIDQSFTSTGIVITTEDQRIVFATVVRSKKHQDIFDRAVDITTQICDTIATHKVTDIAIEGLAYGNFGNATRDLAGLQFVIITTIRRLFQTVAIYIVSPKTIKKFATQDGKASKKAMYDALPDYAKDFFVSKCFGATSGLYDVTDSFWISTYIGTHISGSE